MRQRLIFGITLPLFFGIAAIIINPASSQDQKRQGRSHQSRPFDENRFPVADYAAPEPSDPSERLKRQARGKKYDKSQWNIHPNTQSNMARTHALDPTLPALPVAKSSVVIVGLITDAKAYLSNDKTGVYSVFTVQVHEVIKNSSQLSLSTGASIDVERDGGRVRFPNGRTFIYVATNMPQVGLRYVLFLTNSQSQSDFQILTGYELREGKVHPLDDLPNLHTYENAEETIFLNQLRTAKS